MQKVVLGPVEGLIGPLGVQFSFKGLPTVRCDPEGALKIRELQKSLLKINFFILYHLHSFIEKQNVSFSRNCDWKIKKL